MITTQTPIEKHIIPGHYDTGMFNMINSNQLRAARYISGIFTLLGGLRLVRLNGSEPKTLWQNIQMGIQMGITGIVFGIFLRSCFPDRAKAIVASQNVPEAKKVDPKYRILEKGLNYEGECVNKACEVYEKNVIIPKGLGFFTLSNPKISRPCPACKHRIPNDKIKNLKFVDCTGIFFEVSNPPSASTAHLNPSNHTLISLKTILEENKLKDDELQELKTLTEEELNTPLYSIINEQFTTEQGFDKTYEFSTDGSKASPYYSLVMVLPKL